MSSSIRMLPPDRNAWSFIFLNLLGLIIGLFTGTFRERLAKAVQDDLKLKFPPLEVLPCANVQVEKYVTCVNQGKLACTACRLVSYCSKECQKAHWATHKRDCNDNIRSSSWKPAWVLEGRIPAFLDMKNRSSAEEFADRFSEKLAVGMSLWGNLPAMDIVRINNNESDVTKGLSLAFIASGDLRHVVQTVNCLGDDYVGRLKILLNDICPPVVFRNIILLLILGLIPDEALAADIALHFWYSVFMPVEYRLHISTVISRLLRQDNREQLFPINLGSKSTLSCMLSPGDVAAYMSYAVNSSVSAEQAQEEYDRIRNAPSRLDYRDRMFAGLKPSHRLAFLEFRRFGIVLPFGAINAHFNATNCSLFSPYGEWLQTDYADPLACWDPDNVIQSGRAHGARPEDIYGCLYFHLSDQLRMFARRIRDLSITFYVSNEDARELSRKISSDALAVHGIPSTMRFDRVDVSNILDPNYVGIRGVLDAWGPLLVESKQAAIVGYFMNWMGYQGDARAMHAGKAIFTNLVERLLREGRVATDVDPETATYLATSNVDALYDNSKAFSKFLKKQGLDSALSALKLKLRDEHTIVPHRIGAPVEGAPGDLPLFPDDEKWYRYTKLQIHTFSERFVEFVRA